MANFLSNVENIVNIFLQCVFLFANLLNVGVITYFALTPSPTYKPVCHLPSPHKSLLDTPVN
jgi:hypothetical protein